MFGRTALHLVCIGSDFNITYKTKSKARELVAQFLIDRGADLQEEDEDGNTPLHLAARANRSGLVKLLIDHNVQVNKRNKSKQTALHLVCREYYKDYHVCTDTIKILVKAGANVTLKDSSEHNPIYWAKYRNYTDMYNYLNEAKEQHNKDKISERSPRIIKVNEPVKMVKKIEEVKKVEIVQKEKTEVKELKEPTLLITRDHLKIHISISGNSQEELDKIAKALENLD